MRDCTFRLYKISWPGFARKILWTYRYEGKLFPVTATHPLNNGKWENEAWQS